MRPVLTVAAFFSSSNMAWDEVRFCLCSKVPVYMDFSFSGKRVENVKLVD